MAQEPLPLEELISRYGRASRNLTAVRSQLQESISRLRETYQRIQAQHSSQSASLRQQAKNEVSMLTKRELEVVRFIAQGLSTKQIAHCLGITFKTCVSHRTHLLTKLKVHETASLVRFAVRAGLVEA